MKTNYTRKTSYVLQANTAQMVILLQYNAEARYTLEELVANTGMTEEAIKAQMENLIKMKLFKFRVSLVLVVQVLRRGYFWFPDGRFNVRMRCLSGWSFCT